MTDTEPTLLVVCERTRSGAIDPGFYATVRVVEVDDVTGQVLDAAEITCDIVVDDDPSTRRRLTFSCTESIPVPIPHRYLPPSDAVPR